MGNLRDSRSRLDGVTVAVSDVIDCVDVISVKNDVFRGVGPFYPAAAFGVSVSDAVAVGARAPIRKHLYFVIYVGHGQNEIAAVSHLGGKRALSVYRAELAAVESYRINVGNPVCIENNVGVEREIFFGKLRAVCRRAALFVVPAAEVIASFACFGKLHFVAHRQIKRGDRFASHSVQAQRMRPHLERSPNRLAFVLGVFVRASDLYQVFARFGQFYLGEVDSARNTESGTAVYPHFIGGNARDIVPGNYVSEIAQVCSLRLPAENRFVAPLGFGFSRSLDFEGIISALRPCNVGVRKRQAGLVSLEVFAVDAHYVRRSVGNGVPAYPVGGYDNTRRSGKLIFFKDKRRLVRRNETRRIRAHDDGNFAGILFEAETVSASRGYGRASVYRHGIIRSVVKRVPHQEVALRVEMQTAYDGQLAQIDKRSRNGRSIALRSSGNNKHNAFGTHFAV